MSTPDDVRSAIALVDDLGKSTIHGPLPQLTVHALWDAAATLAAVVRAPPVARSPSYEDLVAELRALGVEPETVLRDKVALSATREQPSYLVTNGNSIAGLYTRHADALACAVRLGTNPNIWTVTLVNAADQSQSSEPPSMVASLPESAKKLPPKWTACAGGRAMLVGHFTANQAWQIHGLCLDTDAPDPDELPRDAPVQPMSAEDEVRAWRQWGAKNCKTIEEYEAERALGDMVPTKALAVLQEQEDIERYGSSEQRWEIWKDESGLTFCAAAARNKDRAVKPGAELFASFVSTSAAAILIWDALRTEHLATEAVCLTEP